MESIDITHLDRCLGKAFACSCGKEHTIPVREIIYDDNALPRLPEICRNYVTGNSVVVIADERTWQIAGKQTCQELEKRVG